MTDYLCSSCYKKSDLTMINGTVLCIKCLENVKTLAKEKEEKNLVAAMGQEILEKENDIYD